MLMRAAPWDSLRAQITLTQLKATVINGSTSNNPPPQPWQYEYAWPADCLKARFLLPTLSTPPGGVPLTTAPNTVLATSDEPTAIPFVVATDFDAHGNPIKVILTNLFAAQLVYVRDLSAFPDLWDALFLAAETAMLASYFIDALARNKAQSDGQALKAKAMIDQARATNASESISKADHIPDWLSIRMQSAVPWAWNQSGPNGNVWNGWDAMELPGGMFF